MSFFVCLFFNESSLKKITEYSVLYISLVKIDLRGCFNGNEAFLLDAGIFPEG